LNINKQVNTLMGCLSVNLNCTLVHELISPNMKYKLSKIININMSYIKLNIVE